jgi:hypothetical protein
LEKRDVGGGLVALQSFWPLKKSTRTFNFSSNEPSPDVLRPLVRYNHLWKKQKKNNINKIKTSVIFLLAKKKKLRNSTFCRKELEASTVGSFDMLNLMV